MARGSSLLLLTLVSLAYAQTSSPNGKWISNLKFFDEDDYQRLEFKLDGTKLTGKLGGGEFIGSFQNGRIEGTVKHEQDSPLHLEGRLAGDRIEGTGAIPEFKVELKWEARREAPLSTAPSKTHVFEPTQFQHFFSGTVEPVLRVNPGDTVQTWAVDAAGVDPKGARRTSGGNPLTGPVYIQGAEPGDALVVHFNRIRLNRDTAISSPLIVNSALSPDYIEGRKSVEGYKADWKLDRDAGFASLEKPTEKLKNYRVPIVPMLGCVGVAPAWNMSYRSAFLGRFGGNMDYNQVREGVTIYLPVSVEGALLYVGDGHALQGAGELTGNALETSMDIEFTVNVDRGAAPPGPRMENADYLMASGIAGSIDEAFRDATTSMVRWLEKRYGLNAAEVSSVVATSVVYDVAEVVDPMVHIVAKIPKSVLASLKPAN